MNDKLCEKIYAAIKAFELADKNSFPIDCGCDDYCECFYNSLAWYDDDMNTLRHSVDDLKNFLAENFKENERGN